LRHRLCLRTTELNPIDVVVLGSGPAGCAAATLLARRSHRVTLISPGDPTAGSLAVSIPPSARRVLGEIGALDAVEAARLFPNHGNSVLWAGGEARSESFERSAAGFHTDRAGLESVLVGVAEEAGVTLMRGYSAREAHEVDGGWHVRCQGQDGERTLETPWLIDATGRHGLIARREGREVDRSTTTLAVVRRWAREGGWPEADRHLTFIESYDQGWAWSVPLGEGLRCYTVMIDHRGEGLGGDELSAVLDRELDRTEHLGRSREGARPVGEAWACPASLYRAHRYARQGLVLAGDAGSFIDPLSSFGVKKALSSGWLAGIVVNTALIDPDMASAAVDFFDAREAEVYQRYRSASEPFFASAAEAYGTPYWIERARAARRAGKPGGSADTSPERNATLDPLLAEIPETDVRAAFDTLRSREWLDAIRGSSLHVFEGPGIAGHRIVMEQRLATERWPSGMRYIRGVDLLRLVEQATTHRTVPDAWSAYNAAGPAATLPDYLTALSTAFAAGLLEHRETLP